MVQLSASMLPLPFAGSDSVLLPPQGMLKGDDLSAAYASADVFMMPSETETLGFVAMEAMSSGLPVVAVAAGGLVDIMKDCDGVTGAYLLCLYSRGHLLDICWDDSGRNMAQLSMR